MSESFFIKCPVEFKKLCLIYPPAVKEIIANQESRIYIKLLTMSQEEIEDEFKENNLDFKNLLTPFEYILNNAYNNKGIEDIVKRAFYFFTHEDITILYDQKILIIGEIKDAKSIKDLRILYEDDFFEFQNLIREAIGEKPIDPPNPNENPRIKEIKAKARYRDKIKLKQNKGLNLKTILASICCMNMGLNPLNIGELSYAAIPLLISTYQEKEKYSLDIDSLLAGADSKKVKPKYWIRNLDD